MYKHREHRDVHEAVNLFLALTSSDFSASFTRVATFRIKYFLLARIKLSRYLKDALDAIIIKQLLLLLYWLLLIQGTLFIFLVILYY